MGQLVQFKPSLTEPNVIPFWELVYYNVNTKTETSDWTAGFAFIGKDAQSNIKNANDLLTEFPDYYAQWNCYNAAMQDADGHSPIHKTILYDGTIPNEVTEDTQRAELIRNEE